MVVLNTLIPLLLIVLLGALLRRSGFSSRGFFQQTNRLVFWVGLPALLFYKTASPTGGFTEALRISLVLAGGMVCCILAALAVGILRGWSGKIKATVVQGAFRGNLAYVGLPVVLFALEDTAPSGVAWDSLAILAIAPLIPVYNIVAVLALVGAREDRDGTPWGQRVRSVVVHAITNPLVVACVLGVAYSFIGQPLPTAVVRTCRTVGRLALPLALMGIGATLSFSAISRGRGRVVTGALIKVCIGPLAGVVLAWGLHLSGPEMQISLLFLGCPTAVTSFVMAEQLGGDRDLAAGIVALSTLLSFPVLAFILLFT